MVAIAKQGLECIIQISLGNSLILSCCVKAEDMKGQECIPVGCVPSTAVATGAGGCIPACTGLGVCVFQYALGSGVSAWGVSAQMLFDIYTPCEQND